MTCMGKFYREERLQYVKSSLSQPSLGPSCDILKNNNNNLYPNWFKKLKVRMY